MKILWFIYQSPCIGPHNRFLVLRGRIIVCIQNPVLVTALAADNDGCKKKVPDMPGEIQK
jgi:hypothetical protein